MLGSGFIENLCRRGASVRVWNRTFDKAKAVERFGARAFSSAAEAARGAHRVHLCLRSDESVDSTLEAALPSIVRGTPVIDHTTVLPAGVEGRRRRLHACDIPFLHAPVFMGPPNAAAGTGLMLASGDPSLFERVRPALEAMTGKVWYTGERSDIAAVYKLMGNSVILGLVSTLADMFAIAQANGLGREDAYRLFDHYDPSGQISGRGKRMANRDYEPTWTLEMAHKDATLMLQSTSEYDAPIIATVERVLRAQIDRGLGDRDLAAIAREAEYGAGAASR